MSEPPADGLPDRTTADTHSPPPAKPIVVGLYGVPGTGKSFLLAKLKAELGQDGFSFYEGSDVIAKLVPGGLSAFKDMDLSQRHHWRERAISDIGCECSETGRMGVVTGHFSFWAEGGSPEVVFTGSDASVYTHILYLSIPSKAVLAQRLGDTARSRPPVSERHLDRWKLFETTRMTPLCLDNGILFSEVSSTPLLLDKIFKRLQDVRQGLVDDDVSSTPCLLHKTVTRLRDIRQHSERENLSRALSHVDQVVHAMKPRDGIHSILVFDADKTLCHQDTGARFWEVYLGGPEPDIDCPLGTLFSSCMGYSYKAFRQAAFSYEDLEYEFDNVCDEVACEVVVHPELLALLRAAQNRTGFGAVVVTCGIRQVWEKVLAREGLSAVKVIGGSRIADGYVVDPRVKAAVVSRIQGHHGLRVCAFGDSPMDLPMLKVADEAVVVTGHERLRSKSMDAALLKAIDEEGLQAKQILLPSTLTPRLTEDRLPVVSLDAQALVDHFTRAAPRLRVLHATSKNAGKLLMTPTRDATVSGPGLRAAHHQVGRYLATEFLAESLGLEQYPIPHVQGHAVEGHRFLDEDRTLVVALMRGGEPMALGVNEAMPGAMFLHAKQPEELAKGHVEGKKTVLLVDSVINSGKSVREFVERVRALDGGIRVVVVAGVVQERAITDVMRPLSKVADLLVVALRISENKFTGRGGTDTGNRLFNTTHLA